jgi:hypothetical protein
MCPGLQPLHVCDLLVGQRAVGPVRRKGPFGRRRQRQVVNPAMTDRAVPSPHAPSVAPWGPARRTSTRADDHSIAELGFPTNAVGNTSAVAPAAISAVRWIAPRQSTSGQPCRVPCPTVATPVPTRIGWTNVEHVRATTRAVAMSDNLIGGVFCSRRPRVNCVGRASCSRRARVMTCARPYSTTTRQTGASSVPCGVQITANPGPYGQYIGGDGAQGNLHRQSG